MPIMIAPLFTPLRITRVHFEDKLKRHMENLGITLNANVEVLSSGKGSLIIRVKDGRLALDQNMAAKIFVTVEEEK